MKIHEFIKEFESNSWVFNSLLSSVSIDQINWRPSVEKWNFLEIVNHLYDEEREDFRARLEKILNNDINWNPIDPEGWVKSRNYSGKDYFKTLQDFINERKKSMEWLSNLKVNDWTIKVFHPGMDVEFTAYQMLASWLAHDYLHIRQIVRLKYQLLEEDLKPKSLEYAGRW